MSSSGPGQTNQAPAAITPQYGNAIRTTSTIKTIDLSKKRAPLSEEKLNELRSKSAEAAIQNVHDPKEANEAVGAIATGFNPNYKRSI